MNKELQNYVDEWISPEDALPSEFLLNEHHPANDQYEVNLRAVQQKIFAFGRLMKPKKLELARLLRLNLSTKAVAKRLNTTPTTIYKWSKEPEVIRMVTLMDHLQHGLDGPNLDHRVGILYRIALDNEEKRPNVSVAALQEINKMKGAYQASNPLGGNGNVYNIQINGELLPRTGLDTLPVTYENPQQDQFD